MARDKKRKRPGWQERQQRSEAAQREDVIVDTAGRFSCSTETAGDFAYQCSAAIEQLEIDLDFNRVAVEIWRDRAGAQELAAALEAFVVARERHHEVLVALRARFKAVEADETLQHMHLEPVEAFEDLIRRKVFRAPT